MNVSRMVNGVVDPDEKLNKSQVYMMLRREDACYITLIK